MTIEGTTTARPGWATWGVCVLASALAVPASGLALLMYLMAGSGWDPEDTVHGATSMRVFLGGYLLLCSALLAAAWFHLGRGSRRATATAVLAVVVQLLPLPWFGLGL